MRSDDKAFFNSPEFRRALKSYEQAMSHRQPIYMDADELTDIAEYYMAQDSVKQADKAIQLAQKLHPDSTAPQIFLARRAMFSGDMDTAYNICNKLPQQDEEDVIFLRAELLLQDMQHDKAQALLASLLQHSEDRSNLLYDFAVLCIDFQAWEQARQWVNQLKKEYPLYHGTKELEAEILTCQGQCTQAIPLLEQILADNPYDDHAWLFLAECQCGLQKYDEAAESCQYALAIDKDNLSAQITLGNALYHLGQYAEAHQIFAHNLYTADSDVLHHMDGICLYHMGKLEEAAQQLGMASALIESGDKQNYITIQQALVESKLQNTTHARELLQDLQQRIQTQTQTPNLQRDLLIAQGQISLDENDLLSAKQYFNQAIQTEENPNQTAILVGIAYFDHGYYIQAEQILCALPPSAGPELHAVAYPYLAMCSYQTNNDVLFLAYLKTAVKYAPNLTAQLFSDLFSGLNPEEYYDYAKNLIFGSKE